jgi:hypothetical protein
MSPTTITMFMTTVMLITMRVTVGIHVPSAPPSAANPFW